MTQTPLWFTVQQIGQQWRSLLGTSALLLLIGCATVEPPGSLPEPDATATAEVAENGDTTSPIARVEEVNWTTASLTEAGFLSGHSHPVRQLVASPSGDYVLGITEQEVALWDVASRQLVRFFPGHTAMFAGEPVALPPVDAAFSLDGNYLATAFYSQGFQATHNLILWDVETGEQVAALGDFGGCRSVAFLDRTTLLSACDVGVQVWDLATEQQLQAFYGLEQGGRPVEVLAVAPEAAVVATVDLNATGGRTGEDASRIRLWRLTNGGVEAIAELSASGDDIAHLEFSADETLLLSQSFTGDVAVWDWQNGQRLTQIAAPPGVDPVARIEAAIAPNQQVLAGEFQSGEIVSVPAGETVREVLVPRQGPASAYEFVGDALLAQAGGLALYPNPVIRLWSANDGGNPNPQDDLLGNPDYRVLSLNEYWNYPTDGPHSSIYGADPETVAMLGVVPLESFSDEPGNPEITSEIVEAEGDRYIIRVTQSGLRDDSVQGLQHWIELAPYGVDQWKVIWAGEQSRCQPGRGHQDWSIELCS